MEDSLQYSDTFVSVFVDTNKGLGVFVNDKKHAKVVDFESNFYSIEEDIEIYEEMLRDSLLDEDTNDIREVDKEDYIECLNSYIDFVLKANDDMSEDELNWEYLESRGIMKCLRN